MQPASLLVTINEQHGTSFALAERYPDGESRMGTYAAIDATGRRGVLKWDPDSNPALVDRQREIGAATARLRERGYPAPLYWVVGRTSAACYWIQEMLPGTPLRTVTPALVPRLMGLNALQKGQAIPHRQDWPNRVFDTVLHGGDGYCLLEPLRTYSAQTAELLATLQALVARHRDERYEAADLVHFDFNPANILVQDGVISGVIDWQDPCSGDCAFDLVTLLFYAWDAPAVRDQLWQHTLGRVGPGALGVYLAHLILRQVDWSIRHHGPQVTASWLRIAREILARCSTTGGM
jgi:hypothetical protein